jgi:hypothetical protein
MAQRRDRPSFALQALARCGIAADMCRKNFDCDQAIQSRIARAIDLAHAARTERGHNLVRAEANARTKRHVFERGALCSADPEASVPARGRLICAGASVAVTNMRAHIAIQRSRVTSHSREPDLKQALRPVPGYERAVREVSRMLAEAGIRHALVGALGANAYRKRPRTTEDIEFLVGDEAFEAHQGGYVTMRVPIIEFDGIDVDQVPLTDALRVIENDLNRAQVSEGVPIAPVDTIVVMKLLAGRTQDLADVEAIVASGADRDHLRAAVQQAAPGRADLLEKLLDNADRKR